MVVFSLARSLFVKRGVLKFLLTLGDKHHLGRGRVVAVVSIQVFKGMTYCMMALVLMVKVCQL